MIVLLATPAACLGATSTIDDDTEQAVAPARDATRGLERLRERLRPRQEDQADRVGLRYAYEGGYDITQGPGALGTASRRSTAKRARP